MNRYENLCREIKQVLGDGIPGDFSGFGAVIYLGLVSDLPTSPLVQDSLVTPHINHDAGIASLLVSLSRYSDVRHDGFHFIHQGDGLTRLSLLVSPPIPANYKPTRYGVGARHRSAELISRMGAIEAVVIVEKTGEIRVFVNGQSKAV
jgi:DNA integrity scanning protein DisA with diadenylate cyclase activity